MSCTHLDKSLRALVRTDDTSAGDGFAEMVVNRGPTHRLSPSHRPSGRQIKFLPVINITIISNN